LSTGPAADVAAPSATPDSTPCSDPEHAEPDVDPVFLGEDPDGPEGNHGQVQCVVCDSPGWLMDLDPVKGFAIVHPGRTLFPCRAAG
jgi:hypothetical protein